MRLKAPDTPPQPMASPWPARTNVPSDEQRAVFFFSFRFTDAHVSRAIRPTSPDPHPQPGGRVHMEDGTTGEVEGDRKPGTDSRSEVGRQDRSTEKHPRNQIKIGER